MMLFEKTAQRLDLHFPDKEIRVKARLLLQFAAVSAIFALGYFFLTFINHLIEVRLVMAFDFLLFGVVVAWVWKTKTLFWPTQVFLFLCWLTTLLLLYATGGIHSVVLCWLPLIPLLALLLLDKTWSWVWLAFTGVQPVIYALLRYLEVPLPGYAVSLTPLFILPVAMGALLILLVITQIFYDQQKRMHFKLVDTNDQLAFSEEELRQNLEELRSMQDMIIHREQQLRTNKEKLERYIRLLMALVKAEPVQQGYREEAVREILRVAAEGMGVSRAGIWHYQSNPAAFRCTQLYIQQTKTYESGAMLQAIDFPGYFQRIMTEGIIVANQARTDPATREFTKTYLASLDIHSMLDVPFYVKGQFFGVLCFEQQHTTSNWTTEDGFFAKSLADIVSLAYVAAAGRPAST